MWMARRTRRKLPHHRLPGLVSFLPRCASSKPPSFPFCMPSAHPPGSFRSKERMNVDVNKQRINKHVYLVASALPGWSDACQIKTLSDTSCESQLVRNYCARRTIGKKA
ncbi:hypothetical protein T08_2917 [Trichinella sp. T8]|nr:hypothetical protein T08_2917 [Trichinella sp. T8]